MSQRKQTEEVVAATHNRTRPWGPRPYHRPGCSYSTAAGAVSENWVRYPNKAAAIQAGHERACKRCFGRDA